MHFNVLLVGIDQERINVIVYANEGCNEFYCILEGHKCITDGLGFDYSKYMRIK